MGGCVAFLVWGLGGFLALLCAWSLILRMAPWTLSLRDVFYWGIVLAMLGARRLSVTRYASSAESGAASTRRDFRLYAVGLLGVALIGWIVAQSQSYGG